jgi:hypothetical protein
MSGNEVAGKVGRGLEPKMDAGFSIKETNRSKAY